MLQFHAQTMGVKVANKLADRVLESGYRKEVYHICTLEYNPHVFSPAPCLISAIPQVHDFITFLV